jgi:cbb3-type cytochrome oxidase subunit 3
MFTALATIIDVSTAGEIGLILFVLIFLGVAVWTFTRSRHEVDHWADIPLDQPPRNPDQDDDHQ